MNDGTAGMNDVTVRLDVRAIARAITRVEDGSSDGEALLREAYAARGNCPIVGVTGPPGAGKSTLIDRLAVHWADRGHAVAILAVDPSSPFTGGAVLGDRLRMDAAAQHPRVFVRSLSSRGGIGGLSNAAVDISKLLSHFGFSRILLETVGAGQSDVDVGKIADVVLVLAVPGLGDHVQAAKAGILEIADAFAVNKADLSDAMAAVRDIEGNLDLVYPAASGGRNAGARPAQLPGNAVLQSRHGLLNSEYWRPPVIAVSARDGSGVDVLAAATEEFIEWLRDTGREAARARERLRAQMLRIVQARLLDRWTTPDEAANATLERLVESIVKGTATPRQAAERLLPLAVRAAIARNR